MGASTIFSTPVQPSYPGGADVAVADGGTGASTAPNALAALGAQPVLAPALVLAAAAPALDGTPTAAMGGTVGTTLFGSFALTPSAADAALVAIAIEDGPGAGTYTTAANVAVAPVGVAQRVPFSVMVPKGRKAKFTKGGAVGVTEAFDVYNTWTV